MKLSNNKFNQMLFLVSDKNNSNSSIGFFIFSPVFLVAGTLTFFKTGFNLYKIVMKIRNNENATQIVSIFHRKLF